jgi:phosphate-selective porin OprO/OprP
MIKLRYAHKFKVLVLFLSIVSVPVFAQNSSKLSKKKGISYVSPDSLFSVTFRFRMQNRASMNTVSTSDLSTKDWEMRVRRLRLRLDGFMINPKLSYALQLSFTRGDMDWSDADNSKINVAPNPVRDAMIFYKPNKFLTLGFGQGKLPGNRQRVNSSGELQFADRSIVNATFTLDRDFGGFVVYELPVKKSLIFLKGVISSGEGRQNVIANNPGLCYTSRIEFLPFGAFTNRGDYFEGDLEREKTPKVSIAGGYALNKSAARTGGQLGKDLSRPYDIQTLIVDGVLKYKGWAVTSEYINRVSPNQPEVTALTTSNFIYTGHGMNHQLSYCFKNRYELAARYSNISPDKKAEAKSSSQDDYLVGISKYLNGHQTKLQLNAGYTDRYDFATSKHHENLNFTFQIELGI